MQIVHADRPNLGLFGLSAFVSPFLNKVGFEAPACLVLFLKFKKKEVVPKILRRTAWTRQIRIPVRHLHGEAWRRQLGAREAVGGGQEGGEREEGMSSAGGYPPPSPKPASIFSDFSDLAP